MSVSHMGAMLRDRREELGISLEMAATATNIRARVLAVIEDGDYQNFPPYGHAMGMISSYARYLETDPRPILQEFEREWTDFEQGSRMSESAERTRTGRGRFGERAVAGERPSQRFSREGASSLAESTGSIHTKLDDEKLAEEDDRYKSGTVKVVGTRQTGDFHRIGARPPKRTRAGEGTRGRGRMHSARGEGSGSMARVRDREADRLFDHSASTTGEGPAVGLERPRQGARSSERSGASRASSRYSRYSAGRYTSRSGSRAGRTERAERPERAERTGRGELVEGRAGAERTRAEGRAETTARRHRTLSSLDDALAETAGRGTGAREGATGAAGGLRSEGAAAAGEARKQDEEKSAPNYFSVEKLDRAEKSQAERVSANRRRARDRDAASSADDGIVARAVSLVQEAFSERRTRIIALAIAAFVVVVIIVAGVLISTAGNNDSGVIAVQGGAADTTKNTSDPNSASATVTTTNGNPVNVAIDVAAGQTSLVNVTYDDDNAYSGTAVGAWHREFLVTESLEATFGNPDAVTVTENGNPVNIDKSSDGTGKMSITIKTTSTSTSNGSADSSDSEKSSKKSNGKKKSSSSSSSSSSS